AVERDTGDRRFHGAVGMDPGAAVATVPGLHGTDARQGTPAVPDPDPPVETRHARAPRSVDAVRDGTTPQRLGSSSRNHGGTGRPVTQSASNLPVAGPRTIPHMPCPPATKTRGEALGPISGN